MNEPDINGTIDLVNRYNALRQELASVTAERDALATWKRQAPLYEIQNVLDDVFVVGRFGEAAEMTQRWLNEVTP